MAVRAGIALVDGDGVVTWTNPGWVRADARISAVLGAPEGADLGRLGRADAGPLSAAIVAGLHAVLAGATTYVEVETAVDGRPVTVAITPAHREAGAVILYTESSAIRAMAHVAFDTTRMAERLTPRETQVLARMMAGLGNRAIATQLGIEYTTVRGHVQSLLAKLGARSRVDAVASAYRRGLIRETDLTLDRKPRRGPADEATDHIRRVREAKVV